MTNLKKILSTCIVGVAMLSLFAACSCDKKEATDTTETPAAVEETNIDETADTVNGADEDVDFEETATSDAEITSESAEDVE